MATTKKMRVNIPKNPFDLLTLADKVYKKHQSMAATSPLNAMEDHSWDTDGPNVTTALDLHAKAEILKLDMEKAYRDRDLFVKSINETVKASRDVLTGVYRENMKRMGDWGFSVDDSPKAKKATPPTP